MPERATIDGLEIVYEVLGNDGPWVALISGGRRGREEMGPLGEAIAAEGFRVLLHDRRNTGASGIRITSDAVEEAVWADDLHALFEHLGALPAFVGGSSSGARTSLMFGLRHPDACRALLLLRLTGGAFAAGRLPQNYYGQFIEAAEAGGMAAICDMEIWAERIAVNPSARDVLMAMEPAEFIAVQKELMAKFAAGKNLPVMGVTEQELNNLAPPVIIIPGNDNTHSSESGRIAHKLIPGSEMHELPIEDEDIPLIPFTEWNVHVPEMSAVLVEFMRRHS